MLKRFREQRYSHGNAGRQWPELFEAFDPLERMSR
jgi:hypothetical protein